MDELDFYQKFDFKADFLFDELSNIERVYVESQMESILFSKGQSLFYEGGVPTGVFLIDLGKVKLTKTGLDGKEQIFYIYKAGDLLGYHAALGKERYEDSAIAIEPSSVRFISMETFDNLRSSINKINQSLISNMGHEFGALANIIGVMAQKSQSIRLATFLLLLERKYESGNSNDAGISLSRENLANIIGTSRESLGRSLKEFKDQDLISIDRKKIVIKNHKRLKELVGITKLQED